MQCMEGNKYQKDESEFVVKDVTSTFVLTESSVVVSKLLLVLAVVTVKVAVMPFELLQLCPFTFREVLVQLIQCPPNKQSCLLKACRHFGSTQDHADVGLSTKLVGSSKAGSRSNRDTSLQPLEPFSPQQFVGVLPLHHPQTAAVADGCPEKSTAGDPAEEFVLHAVAAETGEVGSSRTCILVRESVRVGELGVLEVEGAGKTIHLAHEGLLQCLVVVACRQQSTSPEGQLIRSIVATRQHQSVEQLLNCIFLALDQVGRSTADLSHLGRDSDGGSGDVDGLLLGEGEDGVEGHDFGEAGDLEGDQGTMRDDDPLAGQLDDDEALRLHLPQFFRVLHQHRELLLFLEFGQADLGTGALWEVEEDLLADVTHDALLGLELAVVAGEGASLADQHFGPILLVLQRGQVGYFHSSFARPSLVFFLLLVELLNCALGVVLAAFAGVDEVLVGDVPADLLAVEAKVLGEGVAGSFGVLEAGDDYEFFVLAVEEALLVGLLLRQRVGAWHAGEYLPEVEFLQSRLGVLQLPRSLVSDRYRLFVVYQLDVLHVLCHNKINPNAHSLHSPLSPQIACKHHLSSATTPPFHSPFYQSLIMNYLINYEHKTM